MGCALTIRIHTELKQPKGSIGHAFTIRIYTENCQGTIGILRLNGECYQCKRERERERKREREREREEGRGRPRQEGGRERKRRGAMGARQVVVAEVRTERPEFGKGEAQRRKAQAGPRREEGRARRRQRKPNPPPQKPKRRHCTDKRLRNKKRPSKSQSSLPKIYPEVRSRKFSRRNFEKTRVRQTELPKKNFREAKPMGFPIKKTWQNQSSRPPEGEKKNSLATTPTKRRLRKVELWKNKGQKSTKEPIKKMHSICPLYRAKTGSIFPL